MLSGSPQSVKVATENRADSRFDKFPEGEVACAFAVRNFNDFWYFKCWNLPIAFDFASNRDSCLGCYLKQKFIMTCKTTVRV